MNAKELSTSDVYTMKKFLNSYVNQQRFFGSQGKKTEHMNSSGSGNVVNRMLLQEFKCGKRERASPSKP